MTKVAGQDRRFQQIHKALERLQASFCHGIKIAYYEGYRMARDYLLQDASQIDTSVYMHIHFSFGTLTSTYKVETSDELSTYMLTSLKEIKSTKKILLFGGWDFFTNPR